ncbi:MAG: hypothetical protein AAGC60_20415 [Acidobacteriota bacterium]
MSHRPEQVRRLEQIFAATRSGARAAVHPAGGPGPADRPSPSLSAPRRAEAEPATAPTHFGRGSRSVERDARPMRGLRGLVARAEAAALGSQSVPPSPDSMSSARKPAASSPPELQFTPQPGAGFGSQSGTESSLAAAGLPASRPDDSLGDEFGCAAFEESVGSALERLLRRGARRHGVDLAGAREEP